MPSTMHSIAVLLLLVLAIGAAAAQSPASSDVKTFAATHSGAAAGVVKPAGNAAGAASQGAEKKIGGLDAYVVTPNKPYSAAVLLVPDIFGWNTQAVRRWANRLGDAGYLVVLPDYFKGKDRKPTDTPDTFPAWLKQFPREKVLSEISDVLAGIRKDYPSAKKIGVQGFCWGGLYAALLVTGPNPPAAAAVVYHGSMIDKALVQNVTAPINFQQSDPALDKHIPTALYKEIEGVLAQKRATGLDATITSYPKQAHGFSLRGNGTDAAVTQAANTAFGAGLAFLDRHLGGR